MAADWDRGCDYRAPRRGHERTGATLTGRFNKGDLERSPLEIQSETDLGQACLPRSHGIHGHGTLGRNVVLEAVNRAVLALVQAQHTGTRTFLSRVECQIAGMVDILILEKIGRPPR